MKIEKPHLPETKGFLGVLGALVVKRMRGHVVEGGEVRNVENCMTRFRYRDRYRFSMDRPQMLVLESNTDGGRDCDGDWPRKPKLERRDEGAGLRDGSWYAREILIRGLEPKESETSPSISPVSGF